MPIPPATHVGLIPASLPCISDFRTLFDQLNTVQGSYESRLRMVREVVHEAGRFKRHSLVKLLTQFLDSMMTSEKGGVAAAAAAAATRASVRVNGHSR